jgi:hypothetical protein
MFDCGPAVFGDDLAEARSVLFVQGFHAGMVAVEVHSQWREKAGSSTWMRQARAKRPALTAASSLGMKTV